MIKPTHPTHIVRLYISLCKDDQCASMNIYIYIHIYTYIYIHTLAYVHTHSHTYDCLTLFARVFC